MCKHCPLSAYCLPIGVSGLKFQMCEQCGRFFVRVASRPMYHQLNNPFRITYYGDVNQYDSYADIRNAYRGVLIRRLPACKPDVVPLDSCGDPICNRILADHNRGYYVNRAHYSLPENPL